MILGRFVFILCVVFLSVAATTSPTPAPATQPIPLLTPEEEAKTFNLPPGFHAEVVAAEPMIQHPVAIAWDPDGRLFVAEMRAYMPDTEGWGENKPAGRISILEDTDGDGRMDKSTVFLDKIVLPRAVGFAGDGVLVGTPPKLLFCRDTNGDGKADTTELIANDFGVIENPENSANGLVYNLDNWIYCANWTHRLRYRNGKFESSPIPDMGQFGLARDDFGRMFFNTNSDYLRGTLIPPHYSARNPTSPITIADTRIAHDQKVFPARASTVNRGYREGFLKPDGRLDAFTAACAPHIYRATLLGEGFYGNAFVCEATSNLVRRSIITEKDGILTAKNAYEDREFIASTDERFRPVNLATGPDGALYVVDLHHGLIQHRISLTDWAKAEYKKKQLHKYNAAGRIFRIVPDGATPVGHPQLSKATTPQLVQQLTHPNAWWRETAQRLLSERNDKSSVAPLKKLALRGAQPLDRTVALWTLDGMGQLDKSVLEAALKDQDPKVRANAVRLSELRALYKEPHRAVDVSAIAIDANPEVRLQYLLSFSPEGGESIAAVLRDAGDNVSLRQATISGLAGKETDFLRQLLADASWSQSTKGRSAVLADLARSVFRRGKPDEVTTLVALIGEQTADRNWQQAAMLAAVPPAMEDGYGSSKLISVPAKPPTIDRIASSGNPDIARHAAPIASLFDWPGKPATTRPAPVPLTPRQQELFEVGKQQYGLICAQCHQPTGLGQEGKAPPLLNSKWALGPDRRLARIVLHGMRGPIDVGGKTFNLDMPALKALSDDQIAGVLTFIRRSWGHSAPPVDPATVQTIREWNQARRDGWTVAELLEVK